MGHVPASTTNARGTKTSQPGFSTSSLVPPVSLSTCLTLAFPSTHWVAAHPHRPNTSKATLNLGSSAVIFGLVMCISDLTNELTRAAPVSYNMKQKRHRGVE